MRKLLFLLSLLFFVHTLAFGQKLQYGIKAGLGFATQSITNPDILTTNAVTTFNLTAIVDIPLKNDFYVQGGLGILGKGVKEFQNAQTNTLTITYLDIPVTALYKINLPTLGKIYLGTGPYLSVALSGTNQNEDINVTTGENVKFGNDADLKKLDFGVSFAGGLELNNHLTFNMRYSVGLSNIVTDQPIDPNTTSIKNRLFSIGLGFLF